MNKEDLRRQIITQLEADYALLLKAAQTAHTAATHEECIADNKYDTLGLEASYLAQGQANRAQEILQAVAAFRQMTMQTFSEKSPIRLTALVELGSEDGGSRLVFLGPSAGGFLLEFGHNKITVITPFSPLGRALIGKRVGDLIELENSSYREYEIISVC